MVWMVCTISNMWMSTFLLRVQSPVSSHQGAYARRLVSKLAGLMFRCFIDPATNEESNASWLALPFKRKIAPVDGAVRRARSSG